MNINRKTGVSASAEVLIDAPVDTVWQLLSGIDDWPCWHPSVSRAELQGPFEAGSIFKWKAGGLSITSTIRRIEPKSQIIWSGRTLGILAIHAWYFIPQQTGVLVRSEESFKGWPVKFFPRLFRKILTHSLDKGLQALKSESERKYRS